MESPDCWTEAHLVVSGVLRQLWQEEQLPPQQRLVGPSLEHRIINALKAKGFLTEEALCLRGPPTE